MEETPTPKKIYRSNEQKRNLIQAYTSSGLTVREFCQSQGIFATQFYTWKKQILGIPNSDSFVELKTPSIGRTVEVTFPNGIRLCASDTSVLTSSFLKFFYKPKWSLHPLMLKFSSIGILPIWGSHLTDLRFWFVRHSRKTLFRDIFLFFSTKAEHI